MLDNINPPAGGSKVALGKPLTALEVWLDAVGGERFINDLDELSLADRYCPPLEHEVNVVCDHMDGPGGCGTVAREPEPKDGGSAAYRPDGIGGGAPAPNPDTVTHNPPNDYYKKFPGVYTDVGVNTGFWSLPAVLNYLERVKAVPKSVKTAWVTEGHDKYKRDVSKIHFRRNGSVEAPKGLEPTPEEQDAIKAAVERIVIPRQIPWENRNIPDHLRETPDHYLFAFTNEKGQIVCFQERCYSDEHGRWFRFWTWYDDAKWRMLEPEEGLPLYGLDQLKDYSIIYLHEGAKSARAMQNCPPSHPWFNEMHYAGHIGWVGGARNPHRTLWGPLKNAGITEVRIVADNDKEGRSAIPHISREMRCPTFSVQFTKKFKDGFDLADKFPPTLFATTKIKISENGAEKEINSYVGPSFADCLRPATWLTSVIATGGKGRPAYKLRDAAAEQWVYVPSLNIWVNLINPEIRLKPETLYKSLRPFADCDPGPLFERSYSFSVDGLCYRPDDYDADASNPITDDYGPKINVYRPDRVKAIRGDASPWLAFMRRMFPIDTEYEFMLRVCATLIARPDVLMKMAILLVSTTQGTGKSTLGNVLKGLMGASNYSEPSSTTIVESEFNSWIACKRLVIVHEIYEGQSWRAYTKLKSYITEEGVDANIKFQETFRVKNCATFFLFSNSLDALKIEDKDRRIYAPQVTETAWDKDLARQFYDWFKSGGLGIIKQWALDFGQSEEYLQSHCAVPETRLKSAMIENSKSEVVIYAEGIAEVMKLLKFKEGEHYNKPRPTCIALKDVYDRAKLLHKNDFASLEQVKRTLIAGGLTYIDERLRIGKQGTAKIRHRVFLNPVARAAVEAERACIYDADLQGFRLKQDGTPLPVSELSDYLNEIYDECCEIDKFLK